MAPLMVFRLTNDKILGKFTADNTAHKDVEVMGLQR